MICKKFILANLLIISFGCTKTGDGSSAQSCGCDTHSGHSLNKGSAGLNTNF